MNHLFCFGLGYSCQALARELYQQGWQISGTTRDENTARLLHDKGYHAHLFDNDQPISPECLQGVTHLVFSIPPNDLGDPVLLRHGDDLKKIADELVWAGYLSTTGVYGDRQGGWVDETSALTPSTKRGEKRLKAERDWLSLCESDGLPIHIFRLAGIYGPGSNQLEKLLAGKANRRVKPGQVFSRIHLDDIVGILLASMKKPDPGQAYNVCDDLALPPQDVVKYAAELLNIEPPKEIPFNPEGMSPMGLSFFAESKRVSNKKVKQQLGYSLKYPTYREGLKALLPSVSSRSGG